MAKKFDIETAKNGEHIPCPYCGRTGVLCFKIQDGYLITHEHKLIEVKSEATGKMIPCEVLWDGCRCGKKIGKKHESVEEEFEIDEEVFEI